jgi:hypothetical protein
MPAKRFVINWSRSLSRRRESCRNRLRNSRIRRGTAAQNPLGARLLGLQTLSTRNLTHQAARGPRLLRAGCGG